MAVWPALLLAPLLALAEQSIAYALATPACQSQAQASLHAVPLLFAAVTLLLTLMAAAEAGRLRRAGAARPHVDADRMGLRRYFLAWVATGLGALSTVVIVALWVPLWLLPPCG